MKYRMFAALSVLIPAFAMADDNKAVVSSLSEQRQHQEIKNDNFFGQSTLELKLRVSGPDVPAARKWGNVKITKAQDDAGTDLNKAPEDGMTMSMTQMQDINWSFNADEKDHKWFEIDLRLPAVSARKAATIKILEATVDLLAGGEEKTIEVKDLPTHYGKPIDDPVLKGANITLTLQDPAKSKMAAMFGEGGVQAEIKGDPTAVKVEVFNGAGESISSGSMWSDEGSVRSVTYMTEGKLPADAKLKITAWPGQKKITLPIKLENVKLP